MQSYACPKLVNPINGLPQFEKYFSALGPEAWSGLNGANEDNFGPLMVVHPVVPDNALTVQLLPNLLRVSNTEVTT